MAASKYLLSVTAGPNYKDQQQVAVNSEKATRISSDLCTADITMRIQGYRGLPDGSPATSPYFEDSHHKHDLYSLSFNFTPKRDINGHDLVLGNDFDHPIRDRLPPGTQQAFNIAKWFIDPGLYGDMHADEPYLFGPMLSSINTFRVGPKDDHEQEKIDEIRANESVSIVQEGGDGDGADVRHQSKISDDAAGRKKHFLTEEHLKAFTFEKNRQYSNDFFNPYLDFNEFAIKLPSFGLIPGITIPVIRYWDGQPLRYVLKDRSTDETLFVVIITLIPREQHENQSAGKPEQTTGAATSEDDVD